MSESDTPRSKQWLRGYYDNDATLDAYQVMQELERELADMTKQRDHYKAACNQYSEDEMLCKLQEVTKQRDALAEKLTKSTQEQDLSLQSEIKESAALACRLYAE
jgi:hypothetical protein